MASATPDTSEIRRKGRQRLIGAVTLVLLLVVFVPMLLDPAPRQEGKEPVLAIPVKEGAAPLPAPAKATEAPPPVVPAKAGTQPAPVAATPVAAPTEPPKAAPAPTPAKADPPKADLAKVIEAKSAEPAPAAAAIAAPKLEGFAVQVGAFKDEDRLKLAREKLSAAKVTHFIERLPGSELTRLRAGPYKSREEADKALAAVKAAGLDGKVVPLP
jgi:DedD protein